ncbi:MAG: sulfotransferase [Proteobacteria bacterium]|nr:sulfotransferase [Pseudomonadota bacterium]
MARPPVFLIGSPRSGSTLLARMLGAHSQIHAPAEPHLLTPLAHLGFHEKVDAAPYDPIITQAGLREVVRELPRGEADYLEALRACTDTLYERLRAPSGKPVLLDKTPAYALVLDFAARLYPDAKYVVLTRHPLAVWSSYVDSFFDGDQQAAHRHNPLLERYVPAIARFLRERPVSLVHVRYEALVRDPEPVLADVCKHLELRFEPAMVNYGEQPQREAARGLGDPITVAKESRPTTASLAKWAEAWAGRPDKVAQGRELVARLTDVDLELWGFPRSQLEAELAAIPEAGTAGRPRRFDRYALERRLLVALRRNIHHNALGRWVRRVRHVCDVLLR